MHPIRSLILFYYKTNFSHSFFTSLFLLWFSSSATVRISWKGRGPSFRWIWSKVNVSWNPMKNDSGLSQQGIASPIWWWHIADNYSLSEGLVDCTWFYLGCSFCNWYKSDRIEMRAFSYLPCCSLNCSHFSSAHFSSPLIPKFRFERS